MEREKFSSRLGFLLISAGCAIGLGNVWRFPYITGKYGGGAFVLMYFAFLILFGLPILAMELAVGRGSQKSIAKSFDELEPKGSKFHLMKYPGIAGNYLLMMFYTCIAGWLLIYCWKMISGAFAAGTTAAQIESVFSGLTQSPVQMTVAMIIIVAGCMAVCGMGLKNGVERITKIMMLCLLIIMIVLAINSFTMSGIKEGLSFYLKPDFSKLTGNGLQNAIFDAMGQAFFTLSIGMGSIAIFGSYIGKDHALTGEGIRIAVLDTSVAFVAGLIIFPACFTYNVEPSSGPNLIFVTLPNVFANMTGGRIWGTLFFIFLLFAAISTVIAVFENIISCWMDLGASRKKAVIINTVLIIVLALPCILGFNVWSGFMPFGEGSNIMDLEDFIVSNNILPLGALVYVIFCTSRYGWGFKNFLNEVNCGSGLKFPAAFRIYVSYILPLIILAVFVQGYVAKFFM